MAFKILLQKNFRTEIRRWLVLLTEVVVIILIYVVIVINPVARSNVHVMDANTANKIKFYKEYNVDTLLPLTELLDLKSNPIAFMLAFTPSNDFTKKIVNAVASKLLLNDTVGYATEELLESQFNENHILAGIVFPPQTKDLPTNLSVSIRFPSKFRTIKDFNDVPLEEELWITRCSGVLTGKEDDEDDHIQTDLYIREGFLQLQHMIFLEWYQLISNDQSLSQIVARSFRHRTTKNICKVASSSNLILFLHTFAFLYPFLNLIWIYGRELEENLLVHHWKQGVEYSTHWFAHIFISLIHFLILDIIIIIILKVDWYDSATIGVYRDVDPFFLLIFLIFYNMALIVCVIVIASMFSFARNAVLFGLAMWLTIYGLCSVVLEYSFSLTSFPVLFSIIMFFNNAYPFGMRYLKEISQVQNKYEEWILIATLGVNIFVHMWLLLFVQHFKPGRYMRVLPFDIFSIRYRCKRKGKKSKGSRRLIRTITLSEALPPWKNFEFGPLDGERIVRLKHISTYFKTNNVVNHFLKNVSCRIWKGEITVLLGHNHSGKTTLLSLMAGLKKPGVGWVRYEFGGDIYETWEESRELADICMSNHPLFDYLTVAESLSYYTRLKLKDFNKGKLEMEVHKWLNMLKPAISNKNVYAKHLNYNQKRLLCLCCAMTCDTRIILIDEPTLYMGAPEKRLYWSILQREKPDRAIFLTTFSISEAESIGDRIGILDNGSLLAYGTPFFLKTRFGVGFDLVILRDKTKSTDAITDVIKALIPGIVPENEVGDQLFYKLPSDKGAIFQALLINLEKDKKLLGIDDVRIVGGSLSDAVSAACDRKNNQEMPPCSKPHHGTFLSEGLIKQQIYAMLYKKILYQAPNLIPIIMIFVAFFLIVVTNQMSKVFQVPPIRHNAIILGLNTTETSRQLVGKFDQCTFTDIQSVNQGNVFAKVNAPSFIFTNDSLFCGKETFEQYLKKNKIIYNKYGAVEVQTGSDKKKNYIFWINQQMFHSAPLTLNLLHNMILQDKFPADLKYLTTITNNPMSIPLDYKINLLDHHMSHMRVPLTIGIIMPITISCFIIPIIHEKRHHLIILEVMAGVRSSVYWFVTLIWDVCTFLTYTILFLITMALTTLEGFGFYNKTLTIMLLNIYGMAALAQTYFISLFCNDSVYRSYMISVIIQFLTGICAYVFYWDVIETNRAFFYIASFFPTFSLLDGVSNLYSANKEQEYCRDRCSKANNCHAENMCSVLPACCFDTFFKWKDPGILPSIIYMFGSSILFMCLIFMVQLYRNERKFHIPKWKKKLQTACYADDDPDVVAIKQRIAEADLRECRYVNLVVDQLETWKPIENDKIFTVSFSLEKSNCMAIYGPAQSGKTDLVKKLIGESDFGYGDIYVVGTELKFETDLSYQHLGYCPQDHGFYEVFTTRELLRFFCMLRGVQRNKIPDITREVAMCLDMRRWLDRKIGTLTHEKRRKVNIALALVPFNDVIILDEPTRGLPLYTRKEIWNVLRNARFCGKTIIFTTMEADECEALADYVLVYHGGEMLAYGSANYLRKKATKGFVLEVKLKRDGINEDEVEENLRKDAENLNRFVVYLHEDAVLKTRIDNCLRFYIPVERTTYSNLFGALESNRNRLNILNYTVSQISLDDVLDNFATSRLR